MELHLVWRTNCVHWRRGGVKKDVLEKLLKTMFASATGDKYFSEEQPALKAESLMMKLLSMRTFRMRKVILQRVETICLLNRTKKVKIY